MQRKAKAILHRFTAASAFGRYSALNEDDIGELSLDIAFQEMKRIGLKNYQRNWWYVWNETYYKHLFCHFFIKIILSKKSDPIKLKEKLFKTYDNRGAGPSEHNVVL